ncbi:sodium-dependent bicarbonate transport family permease [Flexithrix dorotheae]|uniref:sodium-dependent bicarbonate transport family permease n=1 Tax=Flexithrix dorotheae TaxID=70993 RepID=UPI000371B723|nr:sodium-dependent bicarbonate transport family permease [Flexithrix dorotheae]
MSINLLIDNLTNPALLFFFLGIIAVQLKSDLEIPPNSSKFISLYLLFSIGFKGGQELAHSDWGPEIFWSLFLGIFLAIIVPAYTFFILRKRVGVFNAGAVAAAYGSVSAVTFVTGVSFLEIQQMAFGGHMVAIMALMEAPSIIVGILLISLFNNGKSQGMQMGKIVKHSFTNGSVLLIMGSLVIGILASEKQAAGIAPFTTDIFKGFLSVFLLDMGITSGKKLSAFWQNGWFPFAFAIFTPIINGSLVAYLSGFISSSPGDQFLFAILASSASYIAVPAAMKMAVPQANQGLYIPMALGVTFPFNITMGMPLYMCVINIFS